MHWSYLFCVQIWVIGIDDHWEWSRVHMKIFVVLYGLCLDLLEVSSYNWFWKKVFRYFVLFLSFWKSHGLRGQFIFDEILKFWYSEGIFRLFWVLSSCSWVHSGFAFYAGTSTLLIHWGFVLFCCLLIASTSVSKGDSFLCRRRLWKGQSDAGLTVGVCSESHYKRVVSWIGSEILLCFGLWCLRARRNWQWGCQRMAVWRCP